MSPSPLDAEAMAKGAAHLVGHHDFTTFRSVHCQSHSPVKTLDSLTVERVGEEIHIRAAARSFLHHQVRSMVGCLALVGRGRWSAGRCDDGAGGEGPAGAGAQCAAAKGCISSRRLYAGNAVRIMITSRISRAIGWLRKACGLAVRP